MFLYLDIIDFYLESLVLMMSSILGACLVIVQSYLENCVFYDLYLFMIYDLFHIWNQGAVNLYLF
jgi:hypothetical protein